MKCVSGRHVSPSISSKTTITQLRLVKSDFTHVLQASRTSNSTLIRNLLIDVSKVGIRQGDSCQDCLGRGKRVRHCCPAPRRWTLHLYLGKSIYLAVRWYCDSFPSRISLRLHPILLSSGRVYEAPGPVGQPCQPTK